MEKPLIHLDRFLATNGISQEVFLQIADEVRTRRTDIRVYAQYICSGKPTFCIGPKLQRMFADTDCGRVAPRFFRLPHKAFYVALPNCLWKISGGPTGFHNVAGFYMMEALLKDGGGICTLFVFWGAENAASKRLGDDALFWFGIRHDAIPCTISADGEELWDFDVACQVVLDYERTNSSSPLTVDLSQNAINLINKDVAAVVRVGINLVLYLNSLEPEVRTTPAKADGLQRALELLKQRTNKPKVLRKAEERLRGATTVPITWIGETVERQAHVPSGAHTPSQGTWHCRRGHMHHFWRGCRKNPDGTWRMDVDGNRVFGDDLVLKWLQPVYRDMAAIIASRGRQYKFTEDTV